MITQEEVRKYLEYNEETGELKWKISTSNRSPVGSIASNNICKVSGYSKIGFLGTRYQVHRIVWLYVYGYFPEEIDHINGIRHDNRLCNLRKCTRSENNYNRDPAKERPSNTGFKGVTFSSRYGHYACGVKFGEQRFRTTFHPKDFNGSKEAAFEAAKLWTTKTRQKYHQQFTRPI